MLIKHKGARVRLYGSTAIAQALPAYVDAGGVPALAGPFLSNATIAETAEDEVADGTVIGTLSATGGTGPYTYSLSGTDAAQFEIDGDELKAATANTLAEGTFDVTIEVEDSAGSPATSDDDFEITVAAWTDAEGRVVGVAEMHSFDDSNAQPIYARIGLAWPEDSADDRHWPAGYYLKARVQGGSDIAFCALANGNTWASGAKRTSADNGVVLIDTNNVTAASSRIIEFYLTAGSQAAGTFDPWDWIDNHASDFTVEITSRSGSSTGSMGNLTYSLQTAIATTTRREIISNTARFCRVKCWGVAGSEVHLICEWHVDFWLDGSNAPVYVEWSPVLTQHWWVDDPFGGAQTKERQTYTATVKYGATTVDTRSSLGHSYQCRWASLYSTDNDQHARKHCLRVSDTTIVKPPLFRPEYDEDTINQMQRAGMVPPLELGVTFSIYGSGLTPPTEYVPFGANGHRYGVHGDGGGFTGRGFWDVISSQLIAGRQNGSASDARYGWRTARTAAQAQLAYCIHVRDHRDAIDGADTTNRVIPTQIRPAKLDDAEQEYPGLGQRCVYAVDGVTGASGLTELGARDTINGGNGIINLNSYNVTHSNVLSGPMAFLEGEKYLGDAALSTVIMDNHDGGVSWNSFGHDCGIMYADDSTSPSRTTTLSIPTGSGQANGTLRAGVRGTPERSAPFGMRNLAQVWMLTADDAPEKPWLLNIARHEDAWWSKGFDYIPAAVGDGKQRDYGGYVKITNGAHSPWMVAWQTYALNTHRVFKGWLTENARGMTGFEEFGDLATTYLVNLFTNSPGAAIAYQAPFNTDNPGLVFVQKDFHPQDFKCRVIAGNIIKIHGTTTDGIADGVTITNGDRYLVSWGDAGLGRSNPIPANTTNGMICYIVNANHADLEFQIAATPGGSAIAIWGGSTFTSTFTADADTDLLTLAESVTPTNGTFYVKVSSTGTLPGGLSATNTYAIRDGAAGACKLATSVGGAAVDITSAGTGTHTIYAEVRGYADWSDFDDTTGANSGRGWGDDDYVPIKVAGLELAWGEGNARVTQELIDDVRAWYAAKRAGQTTFNWRWDGDTMR